jgi:hypothetical protein
MFGSNNYKESLSKSQAGIPRKVKFGPYIFPILVMTSFSDGSPLVQQ